MNWISIITLVKITATLMLFCILDPLQGQNLILEGEIETNDIDSIEMNIQFQFSPTVEKCLCNYNKEIKYFMCNKSIPQNSRYARVILQAEGYFPFIKNVIIPSGNGQNNATSLIELGNVNLKQKRAFELAILNARTIELRSSSDFILEITIKNNSDNTVPIYDLTLKAEHPTKVHDCRVLKENNPWELLVIDWNLIKNPDKLIQQKYDIGMTEINEEEVKVWAEFRLGFCASSHPHQISLEIPVQYDIGPNAIKRILYKVQEIPLKKEQLLGVPSSLLFWDHLFVGVNLSEKTKGSGLFSVKH
ncbi:hypothetical protein [Flavilitoribacter nigricans]|uniref:Uncharacterized protein n=1 Tax=Flavilitoribacter nigricans (strain ATCC 23147 / DSM 23189 / NBRC 102662 / NCIMB 1420 / SS-2) TaxID=1122177 RepID=A0A2D0N878_FLAN2|nr:hypothetical protein [Flavilitoribacter nigricans]PHN04349.1 hypothetical protein CRP01_22570 [Flavilitoribacter nigricans DSM 23189 = NBRC 102662]